MKSEAQELLKQVSSLLDKLAKRNVIHKNKAANQKSKLTRLVNKIDERIAAKAEADRKHSARSKNKKTA